MTSPSEHWMWCDTDGFVRVAGARLFSADEAMLLDWHFPNRLVRPSESEVRETWDAVAFHRPLGRRAKDRAGQYRKVSALRLTARGLELVRELEARRARRESARAGAECRAQ